MEFFDQDAPKFVEQRSRGNHDVVPDALLQKIAAGATRDEGRDEYVRVQQNFHETRVNTSSSVKIP